eukprot:Opistho-1_new@36841
MVETNVDIPALVARAHEAKTQAYCPYSNFRVGAALLADDGTIFTGCNVENSSYGLAICAERTAYVKAVSEGRRKFRAIAVATDVVNKYCSPCGACRQFLAEFGLDTIVALSKPDLTFQTYTVADILPLAFTPEHLKEMRVDRNATA